MEGTKLSGCRARQATDRRRGKDRCQPKPWTSQPRSSVGLKPSSRTAPPRRAKAEPADEAMKCLFVSNIGNDIVGAAEIVQDRPQTFRLVGFRVSSEWCHTSVPSRLLRDVHDFCWRQGGLILAMESGVAPPWVLCVLNHCGFRYARTTESSGRKVMEFTVTSRRLQGSSLA